MVPIYATGEEDDPLHRDALRRRGDRRVGTRTRCSKMRGYRPQKVASGAAPTPPVRWRGGCGGIAVILAIVLSSGGGESGGSASADGTTAPRTDTSGEETAKEEGSKKKPLSRAQLIAQGDAVCASRPHSVS